MQGCDQLPNLEAAGFAPFATPIPAYPKLMTKSNEELIAGLDSGKYML